MYYWVGHNTSFLFFSKKSEGLERSGTRGCHIMIHKDESSDLSQSFGNCSQCSLSIDEVMLRIINCILQRSLTVRNERFYVILFETREILNQIG